MFRDEVCEVVRRVGVVSQVGAQTSLPEVFEGEVQPDQGREP